MTGYSAHAVYINDLPQDFRFAVPSVSTLTPSLSVLIVQFQVHDEPAGRLERAARADYLPDGRAHWDGSNSFRMAEDVRSGALDDVRSSLRLQAQEWLRRYFPGAFAELEKPLPAAEYLILDKERPFPPEREPSLLNVLGLWSPWPPFESAELPGVKLTVERPFHREAVLQLASNRNEALASTTLDSGSGRDEFSLLQALDESLHQNIAQYALLRLLDAYHRSLSELRDAAPTSRTSTRASLRQLKRARAESVAQSVDIQSATAEILDAYRAPEHLRHDAAEWREADDPSRKGPRPPRDLAETWLWELRERAERLAALEERLRAAVQADAALLNAIASLRLQGRLLVATVGALVVALISLLIALK
jgi:hypothetical protein